MPAPSDVSRHSQTPTSRKVGASAGNRGKGRKKGVPNKITGSIKAAVLDAFEKRGGVTALMQWADENPTGFYTLVGKLIPHEIVGDGGGPIQVAVQTWRFGNKTVSF